MPGHGGAAFYLVHEPAGSIVWGVPEIHAWSSIGWLLKHIRCLLETRKGKQVKGFFYRLVLPLRFNMPMEELVERVAAQRFNNGAHDDPCQQATGEILGRIHAGELPVSARTNTDGPCRRIQQADLEAIQEIQYLQVFVDRKPVAVMERDDGETYESCHVESLIVDRIWPCNGNSTNQERAS